jgi:hypothetical protein
LADPCAEPYRTQTLAMLNEWRLKVPEQFRSIN